MFARPRFTTAPTPEGDDMLALMAHAMGCASLAAPPRQPGAATARLTADPVARPHPLPQPNLVAAPWGLR